MKVVLTEETDWIGGQVTSQAVPPDEHPWIEMFGATQLYRTYRTRVREYYRTNYPLTELARSREQLNPGGGTVSRLTHEPRVSLAVLEAMLAPTSAAANFKCLLEQSRSRPKCDGDRVRIGNRSRAGESGANHHAKYFLDATEQGDLLPLTKTEYVTGFESQKANRRVARAGMSRNQITFNRLQCASRWNT